MTNAPNPISFTTENEPIAKRLLGLISRYKVDSVVKELLQNADDAKATVCKFVLDSRIHKSSAGHKNTFPGNCFINGKQESVLGLYGPCLLVHNNSTFTKEDLIGLKRISAGLKQDNPDKIGNFGHGFRTVYNITKNPILIENKTIHFFDSFDLLYPEEKETGPNFNLNDCKQGSFLDRFNFVEPNIKNGVAEGSTFFLPFTTEAIARLAEIAAEEKSGKCKKFVVEDCEKLFNKAISIAEQYIIYLKHVEKIEFIYIGQNGNEIINTQVHLENIEKKNYEEKDGNEFTTLCKTYSVKDLIKNTVDLKSWYIVNGIFNSQVLSPFLQRLEGIKEKVLPNFGAAWSEILLTSSPRELYCGLPLPIPSTTCFHLNAMFMLNDDRRILEKDSIDVNDTDKTPKHSWNEAVIEHGISLVSAKLISHLVETNQSTLGGLVPLCPNTKDSLESMIPANIYKHLFNTPCIPCGKSGDLKAPKDVLLLPHELEDMRNDLHDIVDCIPTNQLEQVVVDNFKIAEVPLRVLSEADFRKALLEIEWSAVKTTQSPFPLLNSDQKIITVLNYCLKDKPNPSELERLPLALLQNGELHKFDPDNTLYISNSKERVLLNGISEHLVLSTKIGDILNDQGGDFVIGSHTFERLNPQSTVQLLVENDILTTTETDCVELNELARDNDWLGVLFSYFEQSKIKNNNFLKGLHFIPVSGGKLASLNDRLLIIKPDYKHYVDGLAELLTKLCFPTIYGIDPSIHEILWKMRESFNIEVLFAPTLLERLQGMDFVDDDDDGNPFDILEDTDALISFFSKQKNIDTLHKEDVLDELSSLPIFPKVDGGYTDLDSDEEVFYESYKTPDLACETNLIKCESIWIPLYKELDVKELTI